MKQAVRENRRGKVRVAEYVILNGCPEVALLLSRMEVCEREREHDFNTRWVWFIGYAPEFEPLMVGERPPEYEAIFTLSRHNGHPGVELMFRPAGQDRRIQEFKEAGEEWLQRIIGRTVATPIPDPIPETEKEGLRPLLDIVCRVMAKQFDLDCLNAVQGRPPGAPGLR